MATRTPNKGLRRALDESRWSLAQLATAVNRVGAEAGVPLRYDETAVCHWLRGTMPRKVVRPFVREALSRKLRRPVTLAELGLGADTPTPGTDTVEGLMNLGRTDMDPSRRNVLGAGLFSVALTVPGWQDIVGRAEAVQTGRASRIGRPEVDMVAAMTERISELDDRFGGRHARPMAASFIVNTVSATCAPKPPSRCARTCSRPPPTCATSPATWPWTRACRGWRSSTTSRPWNWPVRRRTT
jgi:hypothetical protein